MDLSLYILKPDLIDPRFAGLLYNRDQPSLLGNRHIAKDFKFVRDPSRPPYKLRLADKWDKSISVRGPVRKFNDYPCIELSSPAFSERAVSELRNFLEPNGELLPVSHKTGTFYVYNLLTIADILRKRTSKLDINLDGYIRNIDWYDCSEKKLKSLTIFALPQIPDLVHVTNVFKERVEESGLKGFHFIKVWPFEKGVDWSAIESNRQRKRIDKEEDPAGESIIIRLRLSGKSPNKQEKALIARYESELDELLSQEKSKESLYLGQIEGSESAAGEHRISLSCLKANKLERHLSAWMKSLDWPNEAHYVKRNGPVFDTLSKETRIAVR